MLAPRLMLKLLFISQTMFSYLIFAAEHSEEPKCVTENSHEDAQVTLRKTVDFIEIWQASLLDLKKVLGESHSDLGSILVHIEKSLKTSKEAANVAMNARDPQLIQFKYAQTKLHISIARTGLTRATTLALQSEDLEDFAKALFAVGKSVDAALLEMAEY